MAENEKRRPTRGGATAEKTTGLDTAKPTGTSDPVARALSVSTADSARAKTWEPGTVTWTEVQAWAEKPRRGPKDGPCYVLGRLNGKRRSKDAVVSRGVLTLDADALTPADRDDLLDQLRAEGWAVVVYSTASATAEAPRLRVLVLLDRDATPEEYRLLVRVLMHRLG
ncbi:hypothetical protein, partial [Ruania rhizosphaerae]|uniref:hypothetical protein n=1 Tax=Ruania rhizosphaerae TaxID=1840413 RepID=UPI00190F7DD4